MLSNDKENGFRLGILEIYSHHVFVFTLAMAALRNNINVTIYTVPKIYSDLEPMFRDSKDIIRWVIAGESESDWSFLKRIKNDVNSNLDLLCINTVQGKRIGLFYLFKVKVKTIVGAGRISEFFGIGYKLFGHNSIRNLIKHNYTRFFLQKCIPRYKAIIVHTEQAKQFALEHGYQKPIFQMPFSLYREGVQIKEHFDSIRFIVTGSIVESCRDHNGVLSAFERLWEAGRLELHLTILSSPRTKHGYSVLDRMKSFEAKGFPIKYYEGWISEEEFFKQAEAADMFISPLNLNYYSCGELTSGIVETIRQGKPGIYPAGYLPDPIIESSSLFYDSIGNLPELVSLLADNPDRLMALQRKAILNSEHYNVSNVAESFRLNIEPLLNV